MKYKFWDEYSDAKRLQICLKEAKLETNNSTTKADLTNIIKFMSEILDYYIVEDLQAEWKYEQQEGGKL